MMDEVMDGRIDRLRLFGIMAKNFDCFFNLQNLMFSLEGRLQEMAV